VNRPQHDQGVRCAGSNFVGCEVARLGFVERCRKLLGTDVES
jgi:hypothetical protein